MGEERWYFRIRQDDMNVASGEAPTRTARDQEMIRYAIMYAQDGPATIWFRDPGKRWQKGACLEFPLQNKVAIHDPA